MPPLAMFPWRILTDPHVTGAELRSLASRRRRIWACSGRPPAPSPARRLARFSSRLPAGFRFPGGSLQPARLQRIRPTGDQGQLPYATRGRSRAELSQRWSLLSTRLASASRLLLISRVAQWGVGVGVGKTVHWAPPVPSAHGPLGVGDRGQPIQVLSVSEELHGQRARVWSGCHLRGATERSSFWGRLPRP